MVNLFKLIIKNVDACFCDQVASGSDVIDSSAIQFCARKVAAMTGDARKALDICRRSVEVHNTPLKSSPVTAQSKRSKHVCLFIFMCPFLWTSA